MSHSAKPTSPPTIIHPTAVVSPTASLTGVYPIAIGANSIIHLRAKLDSSYGSITIRDGCIVGERAFIGLPSEGKAHGSEGIVVGSGALIDSEARVLGSIGNGSVVEVGAVMETGSRIGLVG